MWLGVWGFLEELRELRVPEGDVLLLRQQRCKHVLQGGESCLIWRQKSPSTVLKSCDCLFKCSRMFDFELPAGESWRSCVSFDFGCASLSPAALQTRPGVGFTARNRTFWIRQSSDFKTVDDTFEAK